MTVLTVTVATADTDHLTVDVDVTAVEVPLERWRNTIASTEIQLVQDYFNGLTASAQSTELEALNASYLADIKEGIGEIITACIEESPNTAPQAVGDQAFWETRMEEWATDLMVENKIYETFVDKARAQSDAQLDARIAQAVDAHKATQAHIASAAGWREQGDAAYARIGATERGKLVDEVNTELSQRIRGQFEHYETERRYAEETGEMLSDEDDAHGRFDFEPGEWAFDDEFSARAYGYQSYGYRGVNYDGPRARGMRARNPDKTDFSALRDSIVGRLLQPRLQRERDAMKRDEYDALPKTAVTSGNWTRLYEKFGNGHMRPCTNGMYNGVELPVERGNSFSGRWEFDPAHSGNNLYKSFAGNRRLTWYYVKWHNAWVDGNDIKWL